MKRYITLDEARCRLAIPTEPMGSSEQRTAGAPDDHSWHLPADAVSFMPVWGGFYRPEPYTMSRLVSDGSGPDAHLLMEERERVGGGLWLRPATWADLRCLFRPIEGAEPVATVRHLAEQWCPDGTIVEDDGDVVILFRGAIYGDHARWRRELGTDKAISLGMVSAIPN